MAKWVNGLGYNMTMRKRQRFVAILFLVYFIVFTISPLTGDVEKAFGAAKKTRPSVVSVDIFVVDYVMSFLLDAVTPQDQESDDQQTDADILVRKARTIPKIADLARQIFSDSRESTIGQVAISEYYFNSKTLNSFQTANDAVTRPVRGYAASYSGLSPPHFLSS